MATSRDHTVPLALSKPSTNKTCLSHSIHLVLTNLRTCLNTMLRQVSVPFSHLHHPPIMKNINLTLDMRLRAQTVSLCTLTSTRSCEIVKICTTDPHRVILPPSHPTSTTWADPVLRRSHHQDLTSIDRTTTGTVIISSLTPCRTQPALHLYLHLHNPSTVSTLALRGTNILVFSVPQYRYPVEKRWNNVVRTTRCLVDPITDTHPA